MFIPQPHWPIDTYIARFSLIIFIQFPVLQSGAWCYYCDLTIVQYDVTLVAP